MRISPWRWRLAPTVAGVTLALMSAAAGCDGEVSPTHPGDESPGGDPTASPTAPDGSAAEMSASQGQVVDPSESPSPYSPSPGQATPTQTPPHVTAASTTAPGVTDGPSPTDAPEATPSDVPVPTAAPTAGVCGPVGAAVLTEEALRARFVADIWPVMTRTEGDCRSCHLENTAFGMKIHADAGQSFDTLLSTDYLTDDADSVLGRVSAEGEGAMPFMGQAWSASEVLRMSCLVRDIEAWQSGPVATPTPAPPTPTAPSLTDVPDTPAGPTPTAGPVPTEREPTATATPTATASQTPPTATPTPAMPTEAPTPVTCEIPEAGSLTEAGLRGRFADEIWPVMTAAEGDCRGCHLENTNFGMLIHDDAEATFDTLFEDGYLGEGPDTMLGRVTAEGLAAMPYLGPRWDAAEVSRLSCLVEHVRSYVEDGPPIDPGSCEDADPGAKTIHRLNRTEYNNTVRDLTGDTTGPAAGFPDDDRSYGYDNIADVLSLSTLHIEKYDAAAELLINNALGHRPQPQSVLFEAEAVGSDVGIEVQYGWLLNNNGGISQLIEAPFAGDYDIIVRAWGEQAGDEPARMAVIIDGSVVGEIDVEATAIEPATYTHTEALPPGEHTLELAFTNDYFAPLAPRGERDRNLIIDSFEVLGPLRGIPEDSESRSRIMICEPAQGDVDACGRDILAAFARRAWRRPVSNAEVTRLWDIATLVIEEESDFEGGIRLALNAVLLSPHFLYRVELDDDPTSTEAHPVSDVELASRLSYFIWSSAPDEALLKVAEQGRLSEPEVLEAQVRRMLDDDKAVALVDNFAGQWMYIRAVHEAMPDPGSFPDFDDALRQAMADEMRLFFEAFLYSERSMLDMLDADFTFLNDRLATHYGLEPPGSDEMMMVSLDSQERGGLLTLGGLLTVTSHPEGTSPVRRGKWVLEQLLCDAPPPPPAGVEGTDPGNLPPDASKRDEMILHRTDPTCIACHQAMDPIGFAMENYSPVSQWREVDDYGQPVDATGVLPDGRAFDGPMELAQVIKEDPLLPRCLSEQLFVYALGRGAAEFDDCALNSAAEEMGEGGYQFRSLVTALTRSRPFTHRRGDPDPTPDPDATPTPAVGGE